MSDGGGFSAPASATSGLAGYDLSDSHSPSHSRPVAINGHVSIKPMRLASKKMCDAVSGLPALKKDYNPEEKRDDSGQWSATGALSATGSALTAYSASRGIRRKVNRLHDAVGGMKDKAFDHGTPYLARLRGMPKAAADAVKQGKELENKVADLGEHKAVGRAAKALVHARGLSLLIPAAVYAGAHYWNDLPSWSANGSPPPDNAEKIAGGELAKADIASETRDKLGRWAASASVKDPHQQLFESAISSAGKALLNALDPDRKPVVATPEKAPEVSPPVKTPKVNLLTRMARALRKDIETPDEILRKAAVPLLAQNPRNRVSPLNQPAKMFKPKTPSNAQVVRLGDAVSGIGEIAGSAIGAVVAPSAGPAIGRALGGVFGAGAGVSAGLKDTP